MTETDNDAGQRPALLLIDDDMNFCAVVSRALHKRGFEVTVSHAAAHALKAIETNPPEYAVVDLKLPDGSGLPLVSSLKAADPHTNIVVLTGYASIATAVEAIKLGASYYLAKPVNADDIVAAFGRRSGDDSVPIADKPLSVEQLEWEHINRVLLENNGNISATARTLSMHRRTLQRKLLKRVAKN
jgi:two-component system response regulator RegA